MNRQLAQNFLVILISLGGASACAYLLYVDIYVNRASADGLIQAGTVVEKQRQVERKLSDNMVWDLISNNEKVYWDDSVQTGPGSQVQIALNDGNKLVLGESSLVTLERDNNQLSLKLKSGQIIVNSNSEGSAAKQIKINGTTLAHAKGDTVSVQLDQKKGQLTAVTSSGDGHGKQITVDKQGRVKEVEVPVTLESPGPLEREYFDENQTNVSFTWKSQREKKIFEVARDSSFSNVVINKEITANAFQALLPPGIYYWRVRIQGGREDLISEVRSLDLIQTKTPEPITPTKAAEISYTKDLPLVEFNWKPLTNVEKYIFEMSKTADFKEISLREETTGTSLSSSKINDGKTYWRVTAVYGPKTKASDTFDLSIKKLVSLNPPVLQFPDDHFNVTYEFFQKSSGIPFRWKPEISEEVRFSLAKSKDLTGEIKGFETSETETLVTENLPAGTYYWTVAHRNDRGEWKYQEPRSIEVGILVPLLPPPQLLAGAEKADFDLLKSPGIKWEWAEVKGAKEYKFKLIKMGSRKPEIVLEDSLTGLSREKKDLPDGTYKWFVSSVDTFGRESKPAEHKFVVHHGHTLEATDFEMSGVQ